MLTMTKMGFFAAHYITKRLGNPAFLFNLASTAVPTRPSTWPAATWPLWAYQSGFFGEKTTKSSPSKKGGLIRRAGPPRRQNRPHSITAWLALVNTPPASWAASPGPFPPTIDPESRNIREPIPWTQFGALGVPCLPPAPPRPRRPCKGRGRRMAAAAAHVSESRQRLARHRTN